MLNKSTTISIIGSNIPTSFSPDNAIYSFSSDFVKTTPLVNLSSKIRNLADFSSIKLYDPETDKVNYYEQRKINFGKIKKILDFNKNIEEKLVTDRNVKITSLSKATGISTYTLYNYRKNPASLHKASQATVDCLTSKYFETYFSRNEIERFRMMLINIVGAYLKETEGNPIAYDPAHALYTMCQKGDWHRLAKMEELWRASYSVERSL